MREAPTATADDNKTLVAPPRAACCSADAEFTRRLVAGLQNPQLMAALREAFAPKFEELKGKYQHLEGKYQQLKRKACFLCPCDSFRLVFEKFSKSKRKESQERNKLFGERFMDWRSILIMKIRNL